MPTWYSIDRAHGIVFTRSWGVVTYGEIREQYLALCADPEFDREFCQLADLRAVEQLALTADQTRQLARVTAFRPGRPRAYVGVHEEAYGMARMFSIFCELEGQNVRVFREWADALQWLRFVTEIPAEALPR